MKMMELIQFKSMKGPQVSSSLHKHMREPFHRHT